MDFGIQESDTFLPLKTMNSEITFPSAETHSITLSHSCRPGCACHLVFKFLVITTFTALMHLIENLMSSMLYIFLIVI